MSRPPLNPDKTVAGIALDPQTLERVVPESRRPDGSIRKSLKIRPGFTPQEDVKRFRGTKQAQMDAIQLPKGHIIGWTPPTIGDTIVSNKPMSKGAKKNAKKKEKKEKERAAATSKEPVPENWEDDDEDGDKPATGEQATEAKDAQPSTSKSVDSLTAGMGKLKV